MIQHFLNQLISLFAPSASHPPPTDTPRKKHQWTIMVYMTGNNGLLLKDDGTPVWGTLQHVGQANIEAMKKTAPTDEIAIIVQFNGLRDRAHTYRYLIRPGYRVEEQRMPTQNMGDPASLSDFITWGMEQAPAEHVAVVLWGHGTGWDEEDIYAYARQREIKVQADQHEVRSAMLGQSLSSGLFLNSAAQIMQLEEHDIRGICYDDTSMDFLDNADLEQAFRQAESQTGQKVDLIGMDACLMSMVEVAYQLRHHAHIMVGSQDLAPEEGWPYEPILQALAQNPRLSPKALAALIVQQYSQSHKTRRGSGQFTQSAIDLTRIDPISQALKQLTHHLCQALAQEDFYLERALDRAARYVTRFRNKEKHEEYVDLHHFLSLLREEYDQDHPALTNALDDVLQLLETEEQTPILSNIAQGWNVEDAHGLSIYLPKEGCSHFYRDLAFDNVGWRAFIEQRNGVEAGRQFKTSPWGMPVVA